MSENAKNDCLLLSLDNKGPLRISRNLSVWSEGIGRIYRPEYIDTHCLKFLRLIETLQLCYNKLERTRFKSTSV